ncbi:chromate transporter [bacterium A37T11]|nr:chromate transporter [bacterium A37T11]
MEIQKPVSLSYLFLTFLKIGVVSFGGHMALIAIIQRIMVEKDQTTNAGLILKSIGIASLLPGPLAVNVVGQVGYGLRKGPGALVSTVAVILPAFLLMLLLSWAYFSYQETLNWKDAMTYVGGVVTAIIVASGIQLSKNTVNNNPKKIAICLVTCVLLLIFDSYLLTVGLLIAGGVAGIWLQVEGTAAGTPSVSTPSPSYPDNEQQGRSWWSKLTLLALLVNEALFLMNAYKGIDNGKLKLLLIFSGISLSLFGGGYVMVPIMQTLFVQDLQWLTSKEFVDAIAFGQATPGPILISATFIGYKVAGVVGATIATAAIFFPSVYLVISVTSIFDKYQHNQWLRQALGGIKAAVVGLILASAYKVVAHETWSPLFIAVITVSFIINFRFRISPVYLIIGAILLGIWMHHFNYK